MIVESTVWVDHYNDHLTAHVQILRQRMPSRTVETGDLVVMEVLRGLRSTASVDSIRAQFAKLTVHDMVGPGIALQAAEYYRFLRTRGITVRSTIDCLIATYCIAHDEELLHSDRDFDGFERHLGLRVVRG